MKKVIIAAAMASMFAANTMANQLVESENYDEIKGGYLFGGSVDSEMVDYNNEYEGFVLGYGYDLDKNVGIQVRYSSMDLSADISGFEQDVKSFGLYTDLGVTVVADKNFHIKPYVIGGLEIVNLKETYNGYFDYEIDETEAALAIGAGVRFTVMQHLSASIEMKRSLVNSEFDVDFDTVSLMAGYKF